MKDDITIEEGGIRITLRRLEHRWSDRRARNQFLNRQTNIHVGVSSETVYQELLNRRERPYTTWKKDVLPVVAGLIERETGLVMDEKRSWDQRLGCSCPCSPGFRTVLRDDTGRKVAYTVWVTI